MMMNYRLQSKRRGVPWRRSMIVALVFAALAIGFGYLMPTALAGTAHAVARPFFVVRNAIATSVGDYFSLLEAKQELVKENIALKKELAAKDVALGNLALFEKENEALRQLLGRLPEREHVILAGVLARPGYSPYDTLIIDIGKREGIVVGSQLLSESGIPIGTIDAVFETTSRGKLYTTPGETLPVRIGPEKIDAVAEGKGSGNFEVRLPKSIVINEGDAVMLPESETTLFTFVERTEAQATDSFQAVYFKVPVSINSLSWVLVRMQ